MCKWHSKDIAYETVFYICTTISRQPSERKRERGREREKDMSTKKPASLMHFTTLAPGKAALNLSQCNMEDKPPAEHPPSRACKQHIQTMSVYMYWKSTN
jgi:hypothetical protein